jgi:hypothetical protein
VYTALFKLSDRRGALCEWALALVLGLKLTRGHFAGYTGASDGRSRSTDGVSVGAQVIDLAEAVRSAEGPLPATLQARAAAEENRPAPAAGIAPKPRPAPAPKMADPVTAEVSHA